MTMQDPISDMLCRIRNAQAVKKHAVSMPASKLKEAIAKLLAEEGFIASYSLGKDENDIHDVLNIDLKYYEGRPVISELKRVSKPGLRIYKQKENLPKIKEGLGLAIITTSKGVMTDHSARRAGLGGEVLFYIS